MSRSRLFGAPVLLLVLGSCGLISLETLVVTTYPSVYGQIIGTTETIMVEFSIPLEHATAEGLLVVETPDGSATGDVSWEGEVMCFTPYPPLPPGRRLVLTLSGTARATDGRSFVVDRVVAFFVDTDATPPVLVNQTPVEGEVVGVRTPIVLVFDRPMDKPSVEQELSVSPTAEYEVAWDADQTEITITPVDTWEVLRLYRWEVGDAAKDQEGVRLAQALTGTFLTQLDSTPPQVTGTQPAVFESGVFVLIAGALEDVRATDHIAITFSEDMDTRTVADTWSVQPAVTGHILRLGEGSFVFVAEEPWVAGTTYHVRISRDAEDLSGNHMVQDYDRWFVPDVPTQAIVGVTIQSNPVVGPITVFNNPVATDPVVLPGVPGDGIELSIAFAQPYDGPHKAAIPARILCEAYFPSTILDPVLVSAFWPTDTVLRLTYTGLVASADPVLCYYRLSIPTADTESQDGSRLEEDTWLLFVAR